MAIVSCFGRYRLHPRCIVKYGSGDNTGKLGNVKTGHERESLVSYKCVATRGARRAAGVIGGGKGRDGVAAEKGGFEHPFAKPRAADHLSTVLYPVLKAVSQMDISISKMANLTHRLGPSLEQSGTRQPVRNASHTAPVHAGNFIRGGEGLLVVSSLKTTNRQAESGGIIYQCIRA